MKRACSMVVSVLACAGMMTAANADIFPDTGDKALAAQAQAGHADENQPPPPQPTQAQIKARQKQKDAATKDDDWLMRSYEHQLQLNSSDPSKDDGTNLYYQLSANKDLARLANVSPMDNDQTVTPQTDGSNSGKNAVNLRSDITTSDQGTSKSSSQSDLFKPLISPLSSSVASSLNNFYASDALASSAPTSFYGSDASAADPKVRAPSTDPNRDSSSIDTPGMTAAEKDPLLDKNNLMLDALPGESDAQAHVDSTLPEQLPLSSNLDRLNKQQDAALTVPGTVKKAIPVALPVNSTNPLLLNQPSPNDPVPDKVPPPSPVRAPIADPFDIFYR